MSNVTIEQVRVNMPKFKEVRGGLSISEHAEITGITPGMLYKIERGHRWKPTLEKFAEFCERTNQEPNAFFEIIKKLS